MTTCQESEEMHGIAYFDDTNSSRLATPVLGKVSFALRENIKQTVRIRYPASSPRPGEPTAIIFLNYRADNLWC